MEHLEDLTTGEAIKWLARFAGLVDRYPKTSTPRPSKLLHVEIIGLTEEHKTGPREATAGNQRLTWDEHLKLASGIAAATKPEVELAPLLAEMESVLARYVAFPLPEQATAISLWAEHTWVFERFDVSPYLAVVSPEKRSGKTRLCEVLEHLVARPWRVVQPSQAVLFRQIEAERPTVLLDEADTIFGRGKKYEPLRAVLNAGNRRVTAIPRCLEKGRGFEVQNFSVFCPQAPGWHRQPARYGAGPGHPHPPTAQGPGSEGGPLPV
ncbi:MAG: hypothetical protein N3B14_04660 [Thermoleophilia bacterium]|nr:hypothetical protein [Thermoleophilia bacterium]